MRRTQNQVNDRGDRDKCRSGRKVAEGGQRRAGGQGRNNARNLNEDAPPHVNLRRRVQP